MEIIFNNHKEEISHSLSLKELMQEKNLFEKTGIAVALNLKVQPKQAWEGLILKDDDSIIVIAATAGG
jgi:sulfur carrier protein